MMSVQEFFYGEAKPVWIINTPAAQVIHHHAQPKPDQYITEQLNFPQPKTPQQDTFHQPASHRDSPSSQMGHQYHLLHQSPPRQGLQQHQEAPQHKDNSVPQKSFSQQLTYQDHQYIQHNQKGQERQQGPLQPISQHHHQNSHNGPPQNSSYFNPHQPSAPPINPLLYHNQQENFRHYARPETQVLRLKVPMCCEACEERVLVSLSAIRGVHSVQCDSRKEKVTVTGSAAPADILKACKKLFKKSEMWVDRYY